MQESLLPTPNIPSAWWFMLLKGLPVATETAVQIAGPDLLQLHQCKSQANSFKLMELLQISLGEGGCRAELVPLDLI